MGNICEICSTNNIYDNNDIIYNHKKNKEEIITPAYLIEINETPRYNSINYNSSNPIQIVYDPSIQIMEYKSPIYYDNYIDNYTCGVLAEIMIEDIFNCD